MNKIISGIGTKTSIWGRIIPKGDGVPTDPPFPLVFVPEELRL